MGDRDKHCTAITSWHPQCETHCKYSWKWSSRKGDSSSSNSGITIFISAVIITPASNLVASLFNWRKYGEGLKMGWRPPIFWESCQSFSCITVKGKIYTYIPIQNKKWYLCIHVMCGHSFIKTVKQYVLYSI